MRGVSSLHTRLACMPPKASAALHAAVNLAAQEAAVLAKARAPVCTGRLRASIRGSSQELTAALSARVPYAPYAERRQAFLLPSARESGLMKKTIQRLREVF